MCVCQQIWRRNNSLKQLVPSAHVLICTENIYRTLQDELQTSVPHLCARQVSTFQTYTTLTQVASRYHDEIIIQRILDIFGILIESEEIDFLRERAFADALIGFVSNSSTTGLVIVSVAVEGKIVELLFRVASRIKIQPSLVSTWFRPQRMLSGDTGAQEHDRKLGVLDKDVFPLFYLTLNYVHHEGRIGEFARTALLYIIETTSQSEALERWIVESDLATLMASGLGALYSQLSRKLVLSCNKDSMPAFMSFSEVMPPSVSQDAEESTSPDFQAHLSTFLSYLIFWQDMLEHCRSDDVKRSLLDHFKLLFLQQLL